MEVPLTEVSTPTLAGVRPKNGLAGNEPECDGTQLTKLANTAAKILDVPAVCISLPDPFNRHDWLCFGPGSERHSEFVASLLPDALIAPIVVGPPDAACGGDGAAPPSYIALPIGCEPDTAGIFCALDYKKRAFTQDDIQILRELADIALTELRRQRELYSLKTSEEGFRAQAAEMSKLKSVLLTNISHETRTPLTTILGFAEILEEEVGDDQKEFVHLIQQGGKRLLNTLMSILDLARLESSSFHFEPEHFDICSTVFDTCLLLEPIAREKGIRLEVDIPEKPIHVFLDVSAVERTVSNLVSNAIKFTSEGRVSVALEADDSDVLIHVADTGIGIGEDFMPYLFDEFKQESEGLARIHEGSGLGLPITKRLVELMKGKIMADSEKGYGSVFTVALPKNGDSKRAAANGQTSDESARPRVLVVEDNADTRTLVNHLLRKNYDVACASNGEEALNLATQSDYDVLLVDINLGKGKSGEDVLHEVKRLPGYKDTPIIAVTAYAMPGDKERFFAEGFDDYVSKPFSKQRLLEALEGVLE